MGLLRDIQNELASAGGDVTVVLRKCKILAARLGSDEFADWVEWELNGYPEFQPTPGYRRLAITYYASFMNAVWSFPQTAVPLQCVPEKHRDSFVCMEFRDGIAKAATLSQSDTNATVERPELIFVLQRKMYPTMNCHRVWGEISSIEFEQLISAVKNRILDFSLKIEAENPDAGEAPPNTHPVPPEKLQTLVQTVVYGNVGAIAQSGDHIRQTVSMGISPEDLTRLVADLISHFDELNLDESESLRAQAQLATLKAQLAGQPDPGIVRQALQTLRNITEGAIGSLLAASIQPGLWHWIQQKLNAP